MGERDLDPRLAIIGRRLSRVSNVLAFVSSKGGVGKTLLSVLAAAELSRRGRKVGLLDLDVTNPTAHIVLGIDVEGVRPEEEKGIIPPEASGIKFMSIAYYSGENPVPLRGDEVSSVIREVLAITRWGNLDYLIIDMPPGMGDELLEVITYIRRSLFVLVTTPSVLSLASARRLAKLVEGKGRLAGVIENMSDTPTELVVELANELKATYLGNVPYVPMLEELMGKPYEMLNTPVGEAVSKAINLLELSIKRTTT
mgnify:CR=1 FL=1